MAWKLHVFVVVLEVFTCQLMQSNAREADFRDTVEAYGDPHVSINHAKSQTCSNPGKEVYFQNKFILITAHNSLVVPGLEATAITQIDMKFMDRNGDVQAEYSARNSMLPITFESGSSTATIDGIDAKVEPVGRHVRVVVPSAEVAVVMSKYKHMYPLLLVRGADSVFQNATGLLVKGCTEIPRSKFLRRKRHTGCLAVCSGLSEDRREACLFDCDMLKDTKFAKQVNEDLDTGEKEAEEADYRMPNGQNAASATQPIWVWSVLISAAICMYLQ